MKMSPMSPVSLRLILFCWLTSNLLQAQTHPSDSPTQKQEILTITSAGERIVPPPPNYRYPNGQTFVYTVEWHLFTAGTAKVSLNASGTAEHVTATAESSGVVNALYKVNDHFEASFDPRTFCSLQITKHTEEGSHSRQSEATFNYPGRKSTLDEKNLKPGETKHIENDLPACVTDVVSGFYYLASLPLQPGGSYVFPISDGAKTTEVTAHVEGKEQVKVPFGTYNTVRVRAEATSGPLQGKGIISAWYTDDANHTPVQMRSKLGWGTLLFRLQRIDKP